MVGAAFLLVIVVAATTGGNKPATPTAPAGGATTAQQQPAGNPPATTAAPAVHHVEYRITGEGGATHASITYNDGGTSISQKQGAALPWTTAFDVPTGRFSVASLSGQNAGGAGEVTCTIIVDGQTVKTGIGSGAYAIASCSGPIEGF
jgi:hypothetical protein